MADTPISVFISYSRSDSAFIDRMEADLRAYGFDTWVDRQHLEGGTDWARLIEQEILKRETLVVSLSPDAITSTWVRREITFALNAGKHIIPIIVRPVERVPIEIIEKQYIDLHDDYSRGLQELRVALLKTRTLPAPLPPAQATQPLLAMPDVNDPLKGLVTIPAPPPAPNPDLNAAFMQAQASLAHDNLDLAEALLRQVVEQQGDFGYGLAAEELERVRKQLEPKQIERLRAMAEDALEHGAWGQVIGALRALIERQPQDRNLSALLTEAENCQKWAWLYDNARAFAQSGDEAATRVALKQLWEKAPRFGDPSHIAPTDVVPPNPTTGLPMWHISNSNPTPTPTPLKPGQEATLFVERGPGQGKNSYPVAHVPFTIGRSGKCDLIINEPDVARLQATIILDRDGHLSVQDGGATGGTFVNGTPITVHSLKDGDLIAFGQRVLKFQGNKTKVEESASWNPLSPFRRFSN